MALNFLPQPVCIGVDLNGPGPQEDYQIVRNQDDAEAVLQPALSDAARHLASQNTPAAEKAAALHKKNGGGFFDLSSDGDGDGDGSSTEPDSPTKAAPPAAQRPSGGALKDALEPNRKRSTSAGQEALRRLSKAFPSFSTHSHALPSLSSPMFSSFSEKFHGSASSSPTTSQAPSQDQQFVGTRMPRASTFDPQAIQRNAVNGSAPQRPKAPRRVTSDESLLYHTLSRASSLGDDDRFQDVREMVNIRLMAIKDSFDVPNFKMPSMPKFNNQSMKSTLSVHTDGSSDAPTGQSGNTREAASVAKDPSAALDRVLEELTGDIVVMGGYRGSILRSADAPHQQLWAPVKIGLNMRKVNLEVGLNDEDEERMEETIIPSGMLKHIGPVDVSRKFLKKLRGCDNARTGKLRVWDYGYDWRLSPSLLSRKLQEFLENLPSNRPDVPSTSRGALVVSHSLGGVITRHAVNQRPELFSGVLFAGTPRRCINILNPLRHGDVVLLNEKLLTAQVNFSMRTSFVFLPEDGHCFVDKFTGEEYPIDFYDPQEWVRWHLSPCLQPALPPYNKPNRPPSSSFSSLLPSSFRPRSDSKSDKLPPAPPPKDRNLLNMQLNAAPVQRDEPPPSNPDRERNYKYLERTLANIKKFRSELNHISAHQDANSYPPLAVLYGKSIPTVCAAQVTCREAIRCLDAYDDLLFKPGDGVVLAKESMLPDGYSIARGGRVCTERGHINMLGDLPAVGKALEALVRGRRKGIGMGDSSGQAVKQ